MGGHRRFQTRRLRTTSIDERNTTMTATHSMTTAELVAKTLIDEPGDFLRESVALVARELMEAEISSDIGAELGERSSTRTTQRNGYRTRAWETRVGDIDLDIPRKRSARPTSPPSWSQGADPSRPSWPASWRPT
jgi:Transposase, Mutator family